jgi:hypothetical protein
LSIHNLITTFELLIRIESKDARDRVLNETVQLDYGRIVAETVIEPYGVVVLVR